MSAVDVVFEAELWEHHGQGAWHFVTVPAELSADLRERYGDRAAGFGSLRVEVTIGGSTWRTSVFPEKSDRYVLPVKKPVRRAEDLEAGDVVEVALTVV